MTFLHKLTKRLSVNGACTPGASSRAWHNPQRKSREAPVLTRRLSATPFLSATLALTIVFASGCSGSGATDPDANVALIHVWPSTLELYPGDRAQLSAWGFQTESDSFPTRVQWEASGGTITPSGLFTAGADAGLYRVTATHPQRLWLSDTSTVSILPNLEIVALALHPRDPAVPLGDSIEFSVVGTTASGDTATVETVQWTATSGSIKGNGGGKGQYKPDRPGRYRVKATSGSTSDSTTVTVVDTVVARVDVSPSPVVLMGGQTAQLDATARDAAGNTMSGKSATWSTSAPSVVAVSTSGVVTAGEVGTATVSATIDGQSGTASVSVTSVSVASMTVSPTGLDLTVGQTGQLTATPRDSAGNPLSGRTVSWSTSAAGVVTVNSSGLVTAKAAGTATITATSEGKSASVTVAVVVVPVASVTVSPASLSLTVGQTRQLTATPRDSAGNPLSGRTVSWSTSAAGMATVNSSGLVTAQGQGAATITATSEGQSGTATVTVTPAGPNSMYFNSAEPGCGSDSNVLLCDDFEDGDWYTKDCDQANASGGLLQTDGWCGTIYANPITPAGAVVCAGSGVAGTNCAATHGAMAGQADGRNMADHALVNGIGVDEIYVRFYTKASAGYKFGAEKVLTFNDGLPGDAGIKWGNLHFNCGAGSASSSGELDFQPTAPETQCFSATTLASGRWYYVETHLKLSTPGQANGVVEIWVNDCGTSGVCSGSPTRQLQRTNVQFNRGSTSELIRVLWFENWANPGSTGTRLIDQVKASRVGPIGFMP